MSSLNPRTEALGINAWRLANNFLPGVAFEGFSVEDVELVHSNFWRTSSILSSLLSCKCAARTTYQYRDSHEDIQFQNKKVLTKYSWLMANNYQNTLFSIIVSKNYLFSNSSGGIL